MKESRRLDRIDLKLLDAIQLNGRLSNNRLAQHIALSESACLGRVRHLEQAGVVQRYIADIQIEAIRPAVIVLAEVTLRRHEPEDCQLFEQAISGISDVVEAFQVSGRYDYLLRMVVTDMDDYRAKCDRLLESCDAILRIQTNLVRKRSKAFSGYPLDPA
jgi:DNA-binding Lrp family transcriptional regulator